MTIVRTMLKTDPDRVTKETVLDFIAEIFEDAERRSYIGELVSQNAHALQCAVAADQEDSPESLVVAALLHDIGHSLHGYEETCAEDGIDSRHEQVGADFLARFFPPEVSEPVRMHVDAKRYRCAVDTDYVAMLSPASIQSLKLQGGPMTQAEIAEFRQSPCFRDALSLRRFDEIGKVPDLHTPSFAFFRPILAGLQS